MHTTKEACSCSPTSVRDLGFTRTPKPYDIHAESSVLLASLAEINDHGHVMISLELDGSTVEPRRGNNRSLSFSLDGSAKHSMVLTLIISLDP
jgi:hypothetical protein